MAFYNGPLNKSIYTQQFELFTKCLLACPNAISFNYDIQAGKKQLYGCIGNNNDIKINLSKLLTKTDFTHVNLLESDSQAYVKNYEPSLYIYGQDMLFQAERSAIKGYTGSAYKAINNCMYQNGLNYVEKNQKIEMGNKNNPALDLIKIMFISSGLNKIMPYPNASIEKSGIVCFRGEQSTSEQEIQSRINSINTPDSFITTPAYTSTSSDKEIAIDFSGKVIIRYEGLPGKSIEGLSLVPSEHEYLLQPSKIQWTEHTKKNIGQNEDIHHFKARVVRPLIEGENDPDFKDIETFKKLVDWAQKNKIDTGFITEYNKNTYLSDSVCEKTLELENMILYDDVFLNSEDCTVEKLLTFVFDSLEECTPSISEKIEYELGIAAPIQPEEPLMPLQFEPNFLIL